MKFKQTPRYKQAFNNLKYYFITTLILAHFDPDLKYIVKTDLSNHALKGVLLQYNKNSKLYLVAFFFQKLAPAKSNYKIYNKELLVIIRCFKQWYLELKELLF